MLKPVSELNRLNRAICAFTRYLAKDPQTGAYLLKAPVQYGNQTRYMVCMGDHFECFATNEVDTAMRIANEILAGWSQVRTRSFLPQI
jgi:hypothetical protein